MYNFTDSIESISFYSASLTVMVVVKAGPVNVYEPPGFAGVFPPGSTTL